MPGMPVTMGQPMPGPVPNMPHGACSGCSAYAGTYSAAAYPVLTYFSVITGQPHRLQDGSGFCGADMHLLKNIDLQKQCIGKSPVTVLGAHHGILSAELLEEKRITNLSKFMFGRTAVKGSYCGVFNLPT